MREDPAVTILGAVFLPQLPPERLASVARAADEAGLEELWLWEDCFRESGIATAATVLALTARARVGIGLLPVPLRNVALTAMEVATLDRLFPGRARVCVGHGVQEWMGQVGARAASPLSLLREYIVALRRLLAGETVTTSRALRAPRPSGPGLAAGHAAPVLAGAVGPQSLRLSGECADGTVLTAGTSPGKVRQARALIDQGRGAVGRCEAHSVVVYLHAATGPGAASRLADEYQRWGYGATARDLGVAGDALAVAEAVQRWAEAGAGTVVLQPTAGRPRPRSFVRFVAQEVRPLVPVGLKGRVGGPAVQAPEVSGPRHAQHRPTRLDGHFDLDGAPFPVLGRRQGRRHEAVPRPAERGHGGLPALRGWAGGGAPAPTGTARAPLALTTNHGRCPSGRGRRRLRSPRRGRPGRRRPRPPARAARGRPTPGDGTVFVGDVVPAGVFAFEEEVAAAQGKAVPGEDGRRLRRRQALVLGVVRVAQHGA